MISMGNVFLLNNNHTDSIFFHILLFLSIFLATPHNYQHPRFNHLQPPSISKPLKVEKLNHPRPKPLNHQKLVLPFIIKQCIQNHKAQICSPISNPNHPSQSKWRQICSGELSEWMRPTSPPRIVHGSVLHVHNSPWAFDIESLHEATNVPSCSTMLSHGYWKNRFGFLLQCVRERQRRK